MTAITWRDLTEKSLAQFQQSQGQTNNCGIFCIAEGVNMLLGSRLEGAVLASRVDSLPWIQRIRYRMWKNGPVTPFQQSLLMNDLFQQWSLPLRGELDPISSVDALREKLTNPNCISCVTIGWMPTQAPFFSRGDGGSNLNAVSTLGWHTLICAAYDPTHLCQDGEIRSWGFVNSWQMGGEHIYWISDTDFYRSWSTPTPFGGIRPLVTIMHI